MSEKEKMLNGELYSAEDKNLTNERVKCKLLCQKYNGLAYDKFEERNSLIKQLFGKVGNRYFIEQPFICDYGYNIEIGENFYSNHIQNSYILNIFLKHQHPYCPILHIA